MAVSALCTQRIRDGETLEGSLELEGGSKNSGNVWRLSPFCCAEAGSKTNQEVIHLDVSAPQEVYYCVNP
jgi:hypothetical protein